MQIDVRHHGWAWVLSSQNRLDHGHRHAWAMDALVSERTRPWTSSWLGHVSSQSDYSMDIVIVGHLRTD